MRKDSLPADPAISPLYAARRCLEEGRPQAAKEILDAACKQAQKARCTAPAPPPAPPREYAATDDGAALREILTLAHAAFRAERSSLWKTDLDTAFEAHGEACENLWGTLERILIGRNIMYDPVPRRETPADQLKAAEKQIIARLQEALPELVAAALTEI